MTGPADRDRPPARHQRSLPPDVRALGVVSLFMDTSSELIHSLLPVFLSSVLGASMATIGAVEGIAEATASTTKIFSGIVSDHVRKRKPLLLLGYGLAAVTKPLFPLAGGVGLVMVARFLDRIGKGMRGAPRDALIADVTPPELRGAAYGLRQALDSVGAFLGPALAVALMVRFAGDIRAVLWIGALPALLSVAWLLLRVHEPPRSDGGVPRRFSVAGLKGLPSRFWLVVLLGAVFTLARFSEAFVVLRAQSVGLATTYIPGVMIAMNVVYAFGAYPAGKASDRIAPGTLLLCGLAVLIGADLLLASAHSAWQVMAGSALWGLHLALTQGLMSKLVADVSPAGLRGAAFGMFNLISGVVLLCASLLAGILWDRFGPSTTFTAGAVFAALTALGILINRTKRPAWSDR